MGPTLVAVLVVVFFLFAAVSACVAVTFTALAVWFMPARRSPLLGLCVLGSGLVGAAAALLFGLALEWVGLDGGILDYGWPGHLAWGLIGYGWSSAAAFVVGSLVRWMVLLIRPARTSAAAGRWI